MKNVNPMKDEETLKTKKQAAAGAKTTLFAGTGK